MKHAELKNEPGPATMDRRAVVKGGLLMTAAAGGAAFAPAVKASTRAKGTLSVPEPSIPGLTPTSGSAGTQLTIDISGFSSAMQQDFCVALDGTHFGFTDVDSVDGSQIVTTVTHVDPGFVAGPVHVMQGTGALSNPAPPPDTNLVAPVFSWIGNPEDPSAISATEFNLIPGVANARANPAGATSVKGGVPCPPWPAPPAGMTCNDFFGTASPGQPLTVDINFGGPTCPLGTFVDLHVHGLQTSGGSSFHFDYHSCMAFNSALYVGTCATSACAVYQQAFFDNHGVFFGCIPADLGGNIWRLTLTPALGESFTGGWIGFRICFPL